MDVKADEQVFRSIIDLIVDHRLSPGERLYEPELVQMLGVSRTPIRQALGRLMAEGVLERVPGQKGYRIPHLNREDLSQVFVARANLEGKATELAAAVQSSGDIDELKELNLKETHFIDLFGNERKNVFAELNDKFHAKIIKMSGNPYLERHFTQLYRRSSLYTFYYSPYYILDVDGSEYVARRKRGRYRSSEEHRLIVEALEAGDGRTARERMEEHILNTASHRLNLGLL